jgi:hypothetical protein
MWTKKKLEILFPSATPRHTFAQKIDGGRGVSAQNLLKKPLAMASLVGHGILCEGSWRSFFRAFRGEHTHTKLLCRLSRPIELVMQLVVSGNRNSGLIAVVRGVPSTFLEDGSKKEKQHQVLLGFR